jgi:hypothetical protein
LITKNKNQSLSAAIGVKFATVFKYHLPLGLNDGAREHDIINS